MEPSSDAEEMARTVIELESNRRPKSSTTALAPPLPPHLQAGNQNQLRIADRPFYHNSKPQAYMADPNQHYQYDQQTDFFDENEDQSNTYYDDVYYGEPYDVPPRRAALR